MNATTNTLKLVIPVIILLAIGSLAAGVLYDTNQYDAQEETIEERIERYKDFPEKDGSELMFLDTRYIIRGC